MPKKPIRNRTSDENKDTRDALQELIRYLSLRHKDVFSKELIVKGIFNQKGKQAGIEIIDYAIQNRGKRYLEPLYKNISEFLEDENDFDTVAWNHLETMALDVDPSFCPKLTREFLINKVMSSEKVAIFNAYIPYMRDLAPLFKGRDNIRIMMLSPTSRYLPQRAKELGEQVPSFNGTIRKNLEFLMDNEVATENVRLYDGLPTTPFYIFDNEIYCGFFLHNTLAVQSPQRQYDASRGDGRRLMDEFNTMWANATACPRDSEFEPARHPRTQAFIDLFPGSEPNLSSDNIRSMAKDMHGVYKFVRYRASFNGATKKDPMVAGMLEIEKYDAEEGVVRFVGKVPNSNRAYSDTMHIINGIVMPYKNFVFLVGDTENDSHPIIVGLQRFKNTKANKLKLRPTGFLLRRHPNGELITGRVMFRNVGVETLEDGLMFLNKDSIYLSEKTVGREFGRNAKELRPSVDGRKTIGLLRLAEITLSQ